MTLINFLLVLLNTLLLVCGQFLWKVGLQHNEMGFKSFRAAAQLILSPYVLGGLAIYGVATVLWLFILSRVELSLAYPIQSLAYIIAVIGAYWVFDEPLSAVKIVGCLLILSGVIFIGWRG
ncbi:MAG: eamA-like transporter family protein [Bacilli bacterium]|jgi:drug/metabolite transporter (DMT)-like permease|nr:eamA-like transporter family protein [Bacilli bacterium]